MPSLPELLLYVFASLAVLLAVAVAATRRVVTAAFLLFACLFSVAGLYVFAAAEFLAVVQVIVYVGGILVLLLFGVMLSHRLTLGSDPRALPQTQLTQVIPALAAALILVGGLLAVGLPWLRTQPVPPAPDAQVPRFGFLLLTDWLVAFEVLSVLLLAALVGAAYLSRRPPAQPRAVGRSAPQESVSPEPFLP